MSQWGLWSEELDQAQINGLIVGYARRERWKARMIAAEFSKLFAPPPAKESPPPAGDDFLRMMGKVK